MRKYFGTITAIADKKAGFLLTIIDETGRVFGTFPATSREAADSRRIDVLQMLADDGRKRTPERT